MKIAFFGTWDFSKSVLQWLYESWLFDIALVISQRDKPVGRKKEIIPTPVKQFALDHDIEVRQPKSLKIKPDSTWEALLKELQSLELDFIVVVAYGKIMPIEILDVPKHWSINLHGSILPLYRWASPIQASIKNGDKITGLTTMYMSAGMDEWDILKIEEVGIWPDENTLDIFAKFSDIWPDLMITTLQEIIAGKLQWIPQIDDDATYCGKISKKDGSVSFQNQSTQEIYNTYRAYTPWPGIFAEYNGKKFTIEGCELLDQIPPISVDNSAPLIKGGDAAEWSGGTPGQVIKINKKTIGIVCADKKILQLRQVKLESKKSMDIQSFVNGNKEFLSFVFE